MNPLCIQLHLHVYTASMLKVWPMLINSNGLIGQMIENVLDLYNFLIYEFLQTHYRYSGYKRQLVFKAS